MQLNQSNKSMSVRSLTLIAAIVAFAILFAVQLSVRFFFDLPTVSALLKEADRKDLQRADNALQHQLSLYSSRVEDNAVWDDAFAYVQQPYQAFLDSNYSLGTLEDNEFDGVMFLDAKGQLIWHFSLGINHSPDSMQKLEAPPFSERELLEHFFISPQVAIDGDYQSREGYLSVGNVAIVFAASQVLPTLLNDSVESRGTMVVWAWLDNEYLARISQRAALDIRGQFLAEGASSLAPVWYPLLIDDANLERDSNDKIFWLLRDVYANPIMLMWLNLTKNPYDTALISTPLLVGVGAALLLLLSLGFMVKRWLINPLLDMGARMRAIASAGDYCDRLESHSYQELETLAEHFNTLLSKVSEQEKLAKRKQAELHLASISDGLTGLANRRYLDQFMDESWKLSCATKQTFGLMLIDVDYFKLYNDTYGHAAGDHVLKLVASLIKDNIPKDNCLAARYGGEEFCVVTVGLSDKLIASLGQLICSKIEEVRIDHSGSASGILTVSIGLINVDLVDPTNSYLMDNSSSLRKIFKAVDLRLYEAKDAGRNCVRSGGIE